MDIRDNIKKLRKEMLHITQDEFATRLNLARNTIALVENKKRNISDRVIADICREFSVNEKWLKYNEGEVFIEKSTEALDIILDEYNLDTISKNIVKTFIELSKEEKNTFSEFIKNVKFAEYSNIDISEDLLNNYAKLGKRSREDLLNYSKSLLMKEKFDQMNIEKIKSQQNNLFN